MENLNKRLDKALSTYEALLAVSWWNLPEDEQEIHASKLEKAINDIEETKRRITATDEVRKEVKRLLDDWK
jgi:hypothetical protein